MSNFIQGMVQQLVADQRANSEESRNQAISIANLAGQEQRMRMLESEYQVKEEERKRKNDFSNDLSSLASSLLFEEKEVADANGNITKQRMPKQFASQGEQIAAVAQLQSGKLALATKYKLIDDKTLQDSYTFSRQLEKDGTNTLIENFFANPSDPKNMAAMATKFGLDPSTTSINLGQDKDGMPTVIASFVGPDGKQQQRDLAPVFNAMGADAYVRAVEAAKTRSAIRENEASASYKRAQANAEGKSQTTLDLAKKLELQRGISKDINDLHDSDTKKDIGNDKVGYIANGVKRDKLSAVISQARAIANGIVKYDFDSGSIPSVNAGSAYAVGKVIASAEWMRRNYSIDEQSKKVTPKFKPDGATILPGYDELKKQRNPLISLYDNGLFNPENPSIGKLKNGRPFVVTTDGTVVPLDLTAKEFDELVGDLKGHLNELYAQPQNAPANPPSAIPGTGNNTSMPAAQGNQALPYNASEMQF